MQRLTVHMLMLLYKVKQNSASPLCPPNNYFLPLFLSVYLKEYWSFHIPTNPPYPFSPFSSYLLATFFKQLVSPRLPISICVHFASSPLLMLIFLALLLFPLQPLFLLAFSVSSAHYQTTFLILLHLQLFHQFHKHEMGGGGLEHQTSGEVLSVVAEGPEWICSLKQRCPK